MRKWALRQSLRLVEFASQNHAPEYIDGEPWCHACRTPWPCAMSTKHADEAKALRAKLAEL